MRSSLVIIDDNLPFKSRKSTMATCPNRYWSCVPGSFPLFLSSKPYRDASSLLRKTLTSAVRVRTTVEVASICFALYFRESRPSLSHFSSSRLAIRSSARRSLSTCLIVTMSSLSSSIFLCTWATWSSACLSLSCSSSFLAIHLRRATAVITRSCSFAVFRVEHAPSGVSTNTCSTCSDNASLDSSTWALWMRGS
jgi:hypothetical protein